MTTTTTTPAEITIGWNEDTRCGACLCDLPAGAPAIPDGDGVLCTECADDNSDAEWIARAVRMAAAEILDEEPMTPWPADVAEREAARLAQLERDLGGPVNAADAEDVFALIDRTSEG